MGNCLLRSCLSAAMGRPSSRINQGTGDRLTVSIALNGAQLARIGTLCRSQECGCFTRSTVPTGRLLAHEQDRRYNVVADRPIRVTRQRKLPSLNLPFAEHAGSRDLSAEPRQVKHKAQRRKGGMDSADPLLKAVAEDDVGAFHRPYIKRISLRRAEDAIGHTCSGHVDESLPAIVARCSDGPLFPLSACVCCARVAMGIA